MKTASERQLAYKARHPERVKATEKAARAKQNKRFRDLVDSLKAVPCADCGQTYPPFVMDFDHRPGETKLGGVAKWKRADIEGVLAEIAKCDVVCSNCHRMRTAARAGWSPQ